MSAAVFPSSRAARRQKRKEGQKARMLYVRCRQKAAIDFPSSPFFKASSSQAIQTIFGKLTLLPHFPNSCKL